MPSTSKKQARFMQAVAHSPSFAQKAGVSQSVGKEFAAADKGKKFSAGGKPPPMPPAIPPTEKRPSNYQDVQDAKLRKKEEAAPTTKKEIGVPFAKGGFLKAKINKQDTKHGKMDMPFTSLNRFAGMKKGGGIESRGKTKGTVVKMAGGGRVRQFAEGGDTVESRKYSPEAEKWLGGADRTDPHIIRRMKNAVADWDTQAPAPVEDRKPTPVNRKEVSEEKSPTASSKVTEGKNPNIDDSTRARALKWAKEHESETAATPTKSTSSPKRSSPSTPQTDDYKAKPSAKDEKDYGALNEGESRYEKAVTGRTYKRAPMLDTNSPEYEKNRERLLDVGSTLLIPPALKAAAVGYKTLSGASKLNRYTPAEIRMLEKASETKRLSGPADVKRLSAPPKQLTQGTAAEREAAAREAAYDARRASDMEAGFKKGGSVKESKAMVNKEVAFFKKKGAPASMIKHEQKEAKEMKFARGGGIESRGKTKGTVIKMASGGAVKGFARGGGIESRGKTRGKMC